MGGTIFDRPGKKVRLDAISAEPPKGVTREAAEQRFEALGKELFALQEAMFGAKLNSVMVVLQGRDGAGKDGTIKHVVGSLNPRGVAVTSFGVPSAEELAHDFLWRVHRRAPRLGEFAIFNRSHYEDVLAVRVHGLVPRAQWRARFAQIAGFERLLAAHGTLVLKFFLHITKDEQELDKEILKPLKPKEKREKIKELKADREKIAAVKALPEKNRKLREIDRYRDASPLIDAPPRAPATSPQIEEAARLLEGKSVVLIGGERRPTAQQAIEEAFRLNELVWIETREHQSIAGFEPAIARDDGGLSSDESASHPTGRTTSVPSACGIRTASACAPATSTVPKNPPRTQEVCSPSRQNAQLPSEKANGMTTRSPTLWVRTSVPTASTTPIASWPMTRAASPGSIS